MVMAICRGRARVKFPFNIEFLWIWTDIESKQVNEGVKLSLLAISTTLFPQ